MSKVKKIGIALIIFGAFIPSVLYPFATLTPSAKDMRLLQFAMQGGQYETRLNDIEIVFRSYYYDTDILTVPYHYVIAFGITIAFIGISIIALTRKQP